MTDQDRGAYTPQTDAPLAFDARRVRGAGGGPAPVTLVVSALVGLLLLIAILLFYRSGVRGPGQPPQVVGAPISQTKVAAAPDSSASSAPPSIAIEATPSSEPKSPTFAPAPEAPAPRPSPAVAVSAPAALPPAPPALAAPQQAEALRPAQTEPGLPPTPPDLPTRAEKTSTPAPKPVRPAKPAPAKAKAADAAASAAAPSAGEPLVQIGAFSSASLAVKGWHDMAAAAPGHMAGRTVKVEKADRDGKTFYRSYVGGFASHAQALSFCEALKAAGKSCMVR